jgi:hypothetical protein
MNTTFLAIRQRAFVFLMKISKIIQSDKLYLFLFYLLGTGRILHYNKPKRYSEKLQVLKIKENVNKDLGKYVDKYLVRSIVSSKLSDKVLNILYGVFSNTNDFDFEKLIYPCVVKTTHDSGSVFPLRDLPDKEYQKYLISKLNARLTTNYFWRGRESPYNFAKPRIIVEKFLVDGDFDSPIDYKFYCFNGRVKLIQVSIIKDQEKYVNYYNREFFLRDIRSNSYKNLNSFTLPDAINEMLFYAEYLSGHFCHVRVDFYCVDNRPIFGEFTFHSDGGLLFFDKDEVDFELGKYITCL